MTAIFLGWATKQLWNAQEVNGQGTTRGAVFRQIEKATKGKVKPEGFHERPPSCLVHLWDWFLVLADYYASLEREQIPGPACWREDLNCLVGLVPEPWEIRILGRLLSVWIRQQRGSNPL